ncbi:MAG: FliH/SctL family protein, partial [Gammaproteobacteria bacterium]|nr:FliH/SctL family protein [Gammaproteobacteria bacterium]
APFLQDALHGGEFEGRLKFVEDPLITRGGCKIDTDASRIDATLETRLAALAASVLVGERDGD